MSDETYYPSHRIQRYPNPYLDITSTYHPTSIKDMINLGIGYYYGNTIVRPIINRLAEYAITDLTYTHESDEVCEKWKEFFEETLDFRSYMIHAGLNRYAMGNHIMSISWPTRRRFVCKSCFLEQWEESAQWSYRFPSFYAKCPKCHGETEQIAQDVIIEDQRKIGLISWDPREIYISYSKERPDKTRYFMRVPDDTVAKIRTGYQHQIEGVPVLYIEAVKSSSLIRLNSRNVYHMRSDTLADDNMAWGKPESMSAFKKIHYGAMLNKNQEIITHDQAAPMDVLWPETGRGVDPMRGQSLLDWSDAAEEQIARHRRDPAYKVMLPGPTGSARLGGNARMLLLTPEIENNNREIAGSMNTPLELVFGGLNWTAGSLQMRLLENRFINHRRDTIKMARWVMRSVAPMLGLPIIELGLSSFKMADDPQTKAMAMQLFGMGLLSAKTLMKEWGWDWEEEMIQRAKEEAERAKSQELVADIQTRIEGRQVINRARWQVQADFVAQTTAAETHREATYKRLRNRVEALMRIQGNRQPDIDELVRSIARIVIDAGPELGMRVMETVRYRSPNTAALVDVYLQDQQDPSLGLLPPEMTGMGPQMGPPMAGPTTGPPPPMMMPSPPPEKLPPRGM